MRVAIISDMHLGYAFNSERGEDPFLQAAEALEKAIEKGADLILVAGDIFDSRVPTQDVLGRAMQLFINPLTAKNSGVKLVETIGKERSEISSTALSGVPVVAIHGTHERRGRERTNAVQLLERAGLLIHIHCQTVVFEKDGEKVAIHGMSGVPENYARKVLETWNPRKVEGVKNIFMLHQSIEKYIYTGDNPSLKIEDLPQDFDLVIDGHIHWSNEDKIGSGKFLIPGSTVVTQMRQAEADNPKGFYIYENEKLEFVKLETPRQVFYKKLGFKEAKPDEVVRQIKAEIEKIPTSERKPLVRFLLSGNLAEGFEASSIDLSSLIGEYDDHLILSFGKEKLETSEMLRRRHLIETLMERQLSVDEMGAEILKKHLESIEFPQNVDATVLLEHLSGKDPSGAREYLKEVLQ